MTDLTAQHRHLLMAWFSPAFPVGAYTYSHGLDWLVSEGKIATESDLLEWLETTLLFGSARNDAIFLAHAMRADAEDLAELSELCLALASSKERHLETLNQGTAFAKTVAEVWGFDLPAHDMPYPVAVGWAAQTANMPAAEVLPLYLHAMMANFISAAVRAVPLGQTAGQRVLAQMFAPCNAIAQEAETAPLQELGSQMFTADMAAMKHETQYSRMFRT